MMFFYFSFAKKINFCYNDKNLKNKYKSMKSMKITKNQILDKIKEFVSRNDYLPKDFFNRIKDKDEKILQVIVSKLYEFEKIEKEIGKDNAKIMIDDFYKRFKQESKKIVSKVIQNGYRNLERLKEKENEKMEDDLLKKVEEL